ncbi:SymE family type I addiction module toxin [Vibrio ruber]|nr:SymE family type I addiction module toxin [Vibrio ruber]
MHLKGQWLREAGFETGTKITVNITTDSLCSSAISVDLKK